MVPWNPRLHVNAVGWEKSLKACTKHPWAALRQAGSGKSCVEHSSVRPAVLCTQLRMPLLHPSAAAILRAPSPFYLRDVQTQPHLSLSIHHRAAAQGCAAGEEISPPARPASGMHQSKASITSRNIPVGGARTSQGRRTALSYPSPFSGGQTKPRSLCTEEGTVQPLSSLPSNTSRVLTPLPPQVNYSRVSHSPVLFNM